MPEAADLSLVRTTRSGSERRQRGKVVSFRLAEDEYVQLQAAVSVWNASVQSQQYGEGVGGMVRYLTLGSRAPKLRKVPRRTFELPAEKLLMRLLGQLLRIGNNVNQIARAVNSGGLSSPSALQDAAEEVRQACQSIRQTMGLF